MYKGMFNLKFQSTHERVKMYEKVSLILGSRLHIKGLKWMKSDSLKGVFNFFFPFI